MTTSSTAVDVSSFTTDAKFRTWGSAVSAALTAAGLTQTSDTGQINWSTVTRPTAASTKAGYEIWRFNDSLQSTKPIYFRIDYGSAGNASGQNPGTWLTVGTGTDGAGTITGVGIAVTQAQASTSASTATAMTVGAAYSTSSGACAILGGLGMTGSNINTGLWVISRTCSSTTGTTDGNGVWVINGGSGTGITVGGASFFAATNYAMAANIYSGALKNGSVSDGSVVQLYKNYAAIPNLYAINGTLGYYATDISAMSTFTASPWGTTHTYLALGNTYTGQYNLWATGTFCPAVIWE